MAEQKRRTAEGVFQALNQISDEEGVDFGLGKYNEETFKQKYFSNQEGIGSLYDVLSKISDEEGIDFGQGTREEWLESFGTAPTGTIVDQVTDQMAERTGRMPQDVQQQAYRPAKPGDRQDIAVYNTKGEQVRSDSATLLNNGKVGIVSIEKPYETKMETEKPRDFYVTQASRVSDLPIWPDERGQMVYGWKGAKNMDALNENGVILASITGGHRDELFNNTRAKAEKMSDEALIAEFNRLSQYIAKDNVEGYAATADGYRDATIMKAYMYELHARDLGLKHDRENNLGLDDYLTVQQRDPFIAGEISRLENMDEGERRKAMAKAYRVIQNNAMLGADGSTDSAETIAAKKTIVAGAAIRAKASGKPIDAQYKTMLQDIENTRDYEAELEEAQKELEDIQALIAKRTEELYAEDEAEGLSLSKIMQHAEGGGKAPVFNERLLNDPELSKLWTSAREAEDRVRLLEAVKNNGGGFMQGLWHALSNPNTYTFGITGLSDAVNKLSYQGDSSESARMMMRSTAMTQLAHGRYDEQLSDGYSFGQLTGNMIPFAAQIAATGGYGGMAEAISNLFPQSMRYLGVGLGELAAGWALANTVGVANTWSDAINRYLGDVHMDANGNYYFDGGDPVWSAIYKAQMSQAWEYGSEGIGKHMHLGARMISGMNRLGAKRLSEMLAHATNSGFYQEVSAFMNRLGLQGLPEEGLEEEINLLANALLVGDNNFTIDKNSPEWKTSIFNPDVHKDIWEGMAVSMMFMGAVPTTIYGGRRGYYAQRYYHYQHAMDQAGLHAEQLLGDQWPSWQERIDGTGVEGVGSLLSELMANGDLSTKQKVALFDYVKNLQKMRGYNLRKTGENAERAQNGDNANDVADDEQSSQFSAGYEALSPEERQAAKDRLDVARSRLEQKGYSEQWMQWIDSAPAEDVLNDLTERGLAGDTEAVMEYLNAKAAYDGMLQRVNDDIDNEVAAANEEIDQRIAPEDQGGDGMIHPAVLKDGREVFIVSGNVATLADNSIDIENSDGMIIVRDADGNPINITPNDIESLGEVMDPAQLRDAAEQAITDQQAQAAADQIEGRLSFNPGDQYTISYQGEPHTYEVVQADENNVAVLIDGAQEPIVLTRDQLQQMADEERAEQIQAQAAAADAVEEEPAAEEPSQSDDTGDQAAPITEETPAAPVEPVAPEDNPIAAMPMDDQGEPAWDQVEPERGHQFLYQESGWPQAMADNFVQKRIDEAEKALTKAQEAGQKLIDNPKPTFSAQQQAVAENTAAQQAAQSALDYWKGVQGIQAQATAPVVEENAPVVETPAEQEPTEQAAPVAETEAPAEPEAVEPVEPESNEPVEPESNEPAATAPAVEAEQPVEETPAPVAENEMQPVEVEQPAEPAPAEPATETVQSAATEDQAEAPAEEVPQSDAIPGQENEEAEGSDGGPLQELENLFDDVYLAASLNDRNAEIIPESVEVTEDGDIQGRLRIDGEDTDIWVAKSDKGIYRYKDEGMRVFVKVDPSRDVDIEDLAADYNKEFHKNYPTDPAPCKVAEEGDRIDFDDLEDAYQFYIEQPEHTERVKALKAEADARAKARNAEDVKYSIESQGEVPTGHKQKKFDIAEANNSGDPNEYVIFQGVYHDPSGYAISSDGHILVADKRAYDEKHKGQLIASKKVKKARETNSNPAVTEPVEKGQPIPIERYPNWKSVKAGKEGTETAKVDFKKFADWVAGVEARMKQQWQQWKDEHPDEKMSFNSWRDHSRIQIMTPDGRVRWFKFNDMDVFARAAADQGSKTLRFYPNDSDRALQAESKNGFVLMMPLHIGSDYERLVDSPFRIEGGLNIDKNGSVFTYDMTMPGKTSTGRVELNYESGKDAESRAYIEEVMEREGWDEEAKSEFRKILDDAADLVSRMAQGYSRLREWNNKKLTDEQGNYNPLWRVWDKAVGWIPNRSSFKKNGEYPYNIDLGALCTKREAFDAVVRYIKEQGWGQNLGPTQIEALKSLLREHGFLTACDICFNETKRARALDYGNAVAYYWNAVRQAVGIDDDLPVGTPRELTEEQMKILTELSKAKNGKAFSKYIPKEVRRTYETYTNSKGQRKRREADKGLTPTMTAKIAKLFLQDPSLMGRFEGTTLLSTDSVDALVRQYPHTTIAEFIAGAWGSATPKPNEGFNIYDPLSWKQSYDKKRQRPDMDWFFNLGGFRAQSFSDYSPIFFYDYVQMFTDLAIRRLPIHIYTKVPALIKLFGGTGAKFNMSLVPEVVQGVDPEHLGLKPDGNGGWELAWHEDSFPVDEAFALREDPRFNGNVGTIAVGISDAHIRMLLDDPRIDMVIPYHKSGMPKSVQIKTGLNNATDYTDDQNTKGKKKGLKDFSFNEALRRLGDPRKAADEYLAWCKQNKCTPKFPQFADHPNYYKVLEDFRCIDNEGNYSPQQPVGVSFFDDVEQRLSESLEDKTMQEGLDTAIRGNDAITEGIKKIMSKPRLDGKIRDMLMARLKQVLGKDNVASLKQEDFFEELQKVYTDQMGAERAQQKVEVLRTSGGIVYGFAVGDRIVLNENYFNAETPMHEFTHVWVKVARLSNPQMWAEGKELLKQTKEWQDVMNDEFYSDIHGDEDAVASEVLARIVGQDAARQINEMFAPEDKPQERPGIYNKIKQWVNKFLDGVRSLFDSKAKGLTYDELVRMPMKALFDDAESARFMEALAQVNEGEYSPEYQFAKSKEEFDETRDKAESEGGIVMDGLNEAEVTVVDVPYHDFTDKRPFKQAESWAKENLVTKKDKKGNYIDMPELQDGTKYAISGNAVSKFLSDSATKKGAGLRVHLSVLKKLKEVIHESIETEIHPDYLRNKDGQHDPKLGINKNILVHRLYGAVSIDGKLYRVKTTLNEYRGNEANKPHSYEVTEIGLVDEYSINQPQEPVSPQNAPIIGVANLLQGVRKSYGTKAELLSESAKTTESNSVRANSAQYNDGTQGDQTRSENFKNWFGDWENDPENSSKVVDEEGKPLVVYHQTNAKRWINRETGEDWEKLDWRKKMEWENKSQEEWEDAWEEQDFYTFDDRYARQSIEMPAIFFSPENDPHHEYGNRTIAVYLNMRNPAINPDIPNRGVTDTAGRDAMEALKAQGYDGFIRTDEDGNIREYGVFDSNQVKSADEVTFDDEGNEIPEEERYNPDEQDIRYRELDEDEDEVVERDREYREAVEKKDDATAQKLVDDAAKAAGMATDENGKLIDLYHGTDRFGFTIFDRLKSRMGAFFTSTRRNVAANYAGDDHYAGVRKINKGYKQDDSQEGILNNARSVFDQDWKMATEEQKQAIVTKVEADARKVTDEIEKRQADVETLPTDEELDIANATAWVMDLFYTVAYAKENGNEGEDLYRLVSNGVEMYNENKQVIRDYVSKHYDELDEKQKNYLNYLTGWDSGDVAIDIECSYKRVVSGKDLATVTGDSMLTLDELKKNTDEAHNIGAYHLYGNLGDNPLVVDAEGKNWYSLEYDGRKFDTDTLAQYAKENGYTALVVKNVYDYGDKADDYIFFEPSQLKSADPATYDDNGELIPLSQRFDIGVDDIRMREILEDGGTLRVYQSEGKWRVEGVPGEFNTQFSAVDNARNFLQGHVFEVAEDGNSIEVLGAGSNLDNMLGTDTAAEQRPTGQATAKQRKAEERARKWRERTVENGRRRVEELGQRLGVKVTIVDDMSEQERDGMSKKKRRAKGWYDVRTGEVFINLGNHKTVSDIEATFLHEVVAHKGLRRLFGEEFNTFLHNVYYNVDASIREEINRLMAKNNWDYREATEEYLAKLAQQMNFERPEKYVKAWETVARMFRQLLQKMGLGNGMNLKDSDLQGILFESYHNMEKEGVAGLAESVEFRDAMEREANLPRQSRDTENPAATAAESMFRDDEDEEDFEDSEDFYEEELEEEAENPEDLGEDFDDSEAGPSTFKETILGKVLQAANSAGAAQSARVSAMRSLGGALQQIRKAMSTQRNYDRETVNTIVRLAREVMASGYFNDLTRGEVKRLLAAAKNANGSANVTEQANKVVDTLLRHHLRECENLLKKQLKVKGSKENASGVEVQAGLDIEGQRMSTAMKQGMRLDEPGLRQRIAECLSRMGSSDPVVSSVAAQEYTGLMLAQQYHDTIKASRQEEQNMREEMRQTKAEFAARRDSLSPEELKRQRQDLKDYIAATEDAIRQNRMERADAYNQLSEMLGGGIASSMERAKQWREQQRERVGEIQHNANSDLENVPADEHMRPTLKHRMANWAVVRFFMKPLATFDYMLRMMGQKSPNGEGYLWNRFMGGWVEANDNEWRNVKAAHQVLDEKAKEVFNADRPGLPKFKVKRWSDLFFIERKMEGMDVDFWDGDEIKTHTLTPGNLLYIYMVNKMSDGKMKLRKMGISEEDVDAIRDHLDPRLIELADWLQDEFLVQKRTEYNAVHERMFGAPMAAIENYFPLKINSRSRSQEEDVNNQDANPDDNKGSTITGAIIKRVRNNKALDLTGADAFDVILEHIQNMEHWAAFAEFNRDLNTLLSYKRFRNRILNMASARFGSGQKLWTNFKRTCAIASGVYRPKVDFDSVDTNLVNVAKGVTRAKISFRFYTALKQLLSYPAYLSEASPIELAKTTNPIGAVKAWKWAIDNLPGFAERWQSRQAGDTRLKDSDADWGLWKKQIIDTASRWGMSPNAFVDALTVAMGAKAIYETRFKQLKKLGYTEEQAKQRAQRDASVAYNETQQSSANAYTSAMQLDRTAASVALTVFRNASMGYERRLLQSFANLKHMATKGYKEQSLEYLAKQMERDGLDKATAEAAAKKVYNRALYKNVADVAIFGWVVQAAWNLGSYLPYLFMGDDDDEKDKMLDDAMLHAIAGGIEGLTGGSVISDTYNTIRSGEANMYSNELLPLLSDIESLKRTFKKDVIEGANDLVNLLVQAGVGVNPQTITDWVVAGLDAVHGDPRLANEFGLLVMRVMSAPQGQLDKLYIDELGITAGDARKLNAEEFAQRYARYKMGRESTFTGWAYSEAGRDDAVGHYVKNFDKKLKERLGTQAIATLEDAYERGDAHMQDLVGKAIKKRLEGMEDGEVEHVMKYTTNDVTKEAASKEVVKRISKKEDLDGYFDNTTDPALRKAAGSEIAKRLGTQDYPSHIQKRWSQETRDAYERYLELRTSEDIHEDSQIYLKASKDERKELLEIKKQLGQGGDDDAIMQEYRKARAEILRNYK